MMKMNWHFRLWQWHSNRHGRSTARQASLSPSALRFQLCKLAGKGFYKPTCAQPGSRGIRPTGCTFCSRGSGAGSGGRVRAERRWQHRRGLHDPARVPCVL